MKKIIIAIITSIPMLVFAQETFTLKGKIATSSNGMLYINNIKDNKLDSVKVNNGEFTYSGTVESPTMVNLFMFPDGISYKSLKSQNDYLKADESLVIIIKGQTNLTGQTIRKAKLSGTDLNVSFDEYKKFISKIEDDKEQLKADMIAYSDNGNLDDLSSSKIFEERLRIINNEISSAKKEFVETYKTEYALFLLHDELFSWYGWKASEKLLKSFPENLQLSNTGIDLAKKIESLKPLVIGSLAPDFKLPNTDGKEVALSSLRGKYVLVDFWASWCGPCRLENPHILAAYNKFKDKGFTILGVSLDFPGKKDNWTKAIENDQLGQWTHVSDLKGWASSVSGLYRVTAIPQNYLLDKDGKIIAHNLIGDALEEKLAEILN